MSTRKHEGSKLPQGASIHAALEEYNIANRLPVVNPPPSVELRLLSEPEVEIRFLPDETKHVPDLLLANTGWIAVMPDVPVRQPIAEPPFCATGEFHVFGEQTHFLVQLPEQGIPRTFFALDAPLGELPGLLPYTPGPE